MTRRSGSPFAAAAIDYTLAGFAVFPLLPARKTPLTRHGFKDASRDASTVERWWRRWPAANIGIATGQASELYVIDLDGPAGEDAWQSLARNRYLPASWWSSTGRGRHLWYRATDTYARLPNASLAPRLDTRGQGGYIVAAPSIHPSGARYVLHTGGRPLADLPGWLASRIVERTERRLAAPGVRRPLAAGEIIPEGERRLHGLVRLVERTGEGNRHRALYWAACRAGELIRDGLVSDVIAEGELFAAAEANGLVADEGEQLVRRTIRDGSKAAAA